MKQVDAGFLGDLMPLNTYLYYDGPRSYSSKHENRLFYCHQCDECSEYDSFFVRQVTENEINELENNKISMYDFLLNSKPLYLVQQARNHFKAFEVDIDECIKDFPVKDVYLFWDGGDGK